jgi:hypothetical protein
MQAFADLLGLYWPFLLAALAAGLVIGWRAYARAPERPR